MSRLKEIIQADGRQQKELAEAIGEDAGMMSRYVNYKCLPIPAVMDKLTAELGCAVDDIYLPHEIRYNTTCKRIERKRKTKQDSYRWTVPLPGEARQFFKDGRLQECGFATPTAFGRWCFEELKRRYAILVKEKDDTDRRPKHG